MEVKDTVKPGVPAAQPKKREPAKPKEPEAAKPKEEGTVKVQSVVGVMWSPDDEIYISSEVVEVKDSSWLKSQESAGKIKRME